MLLAYAGGLLCASLGVRALWKEPHALVARAFALGMLVLALRETLVGLGAQAILPLAGLRYRSLAWMLTTVVPASWLLFSLTFARRNARELLARWRWSLVGALVVPAVVLLAFSPTVVVRQARGEPDLLPLLSLGWAGSLLGLGGLLTAVMVLMNLEGSLRAAAGMKRQQIKCMVLGVGSMFAAYIYTMSQTLVFATITPTMQMIDSWAVLVGTMLIITSLVRQRLGSVSVSLSQTTVFNSLTVLLVGIYLLAVGVLTNVITALGRYHLLPLGAFFLLVALVSLAAVLLSDRLRQRGKRLISRYVYHARHDYRHVWMTFTRRTASIMDVQKLCAEVVRMLAETFAVSAVTIWLWDREAPEQVRLGGSTVFSEDQAEPPGFTAEDLAELLGYLREHQLPIDFAAPPDAEGQALAQSHADRLRQARIRYALPLMAGQELIGLLTLHERLTGESFTLEDENLLKTLADQAATTLLTLQQAQRLARAQRLETFQTLSAFFVHDLKNLASKLSMTLRTLPVHYDNPAFREDLLQLMADSLTKIDATCSRVSLLTSGLELRWAETDVNELIRATLTHLQPALTVPLVLDLHPLPHLRVDPEQMEKVLVNLVLNAQHAVDTNGEIRVSSERVNDWVVLAVRDNGCGMSREFMQNSLFQPFCTTKRRGLGIGLFQSKKIVEAHEGKLEVESEAGKGSTFRVLLRC